MTLNKLFENPGKTVKAIAKFCCYACLTLAIILFIIGAIKVVSAASDNSTTLGEELFYSEEFYRYGDINGYTGKMLCIAAFYFALASLSSIPLYAFGCLVEDTAAIKEKLQQKHE